MQYKLLLLDIDGTTVASKENALPTQRVIDAIAAGRDHIAITVATGRPFELAKPVIEALGLTGLGVFNGGAEIINMQTGEVVHRQDLDIATCKELVRLALPFGYSISSDNENYEKPYQSPDEVKRPTAKIFIEAVKNSDAIHILEQLNGVPDAEAHPTTSWIDGDVVDIHITHHQANKRHGAEQLIALLNLSKEQVIAVGDGYNDMPLLEAAGLKVAMGDAPTEVQALADYVTSSLADDGVANVIETYVLP